MAKIGVTRPLDNLGRIVIPVEIRRSMGLQPDDYLAFETTDHSIIMSMAIDECTICGSTENLQIFSGKHLCMDCISNIQRRRFG